MPLIYSTSHILIPKPVFGVLKNLGILFEAPYFSYNWERQFYNGLETSGRQMTGCPADTCSNFFWIREYVELLFDITAENLFWVRGHTASVCRIHTSMQLPSFRI